MVSVNVVGMSDTVTASSDEFRDGQRHAVEGDRTLADHVAQQFPRHSEGEVVPLGLRVASDERGDAVDVALHDVAAEPAVAAHRALKVDARTRVRDRRASDVFGVMRMTSAVQLAVLERRHRQAHAVHRDGLAVDEVVAEPGAVSTRW